MPNLTDVLSTTDGNQTSRVYDISREINTLTTFEALVTNYAIMDQRPTINNGAGYGTGDTDLVVTDATVFTKYDMVKNVRTSEVYQVTAVDYVTNTITVKRNIGSTGAVAIVDGDGVLNVGPAYYENSTTPDVNMANTSTVYNYVQTMRRAWGLSGLRDRTRSTPGMSLEEIGQTEAREFLRALEYAMIFGHRELDTSTFSDNRYSTGGLDYYISTNEEDVSGTLSEAEWQTFLVEKAFNKGSREKVFICGDNYFRCLTKWAGDYLQVPIEINGLGVTVAQYTAPTGEILYLYNHELFKGNSVLQGLGYVVDVENIRARYTQNPDNPSKNGILSIREGIEANGTDGVINEYFAEMGLELRNEQTHAVIRNVTGPTT